MKQQASKTPVSEMVVTACSECGQNFYAEKDHPNQDKADVCHVCPDCLGNYNKPDPDRWARG